jgi:hypothetical protein
MTPRSIIIVGFVAVCGAGLWGILSQGRQVSELQAEQNRLESVRLATNNPPAEIIATPSPTPEVPRELLQLRAEVARLSQQQRELAVTRQENERLRLQLENRRTNHAAAGFMGTGYVRKSELKWLGYNSPEDTLQSLFWAMKNHDLDKLLGALTSEQAQQFREAFQLTHDSAEQFFKSQEPGMPPGFRISDRHQNDDGTILLRVDVAPDIPGETFTFRQIGGQWKIAATH